MSGSIVDQLVWTLCDGSAVTHSVACLKDEPDITLFCVEELAEKEEPVAEFEKLERYQLLGAFVPDAHEEEGQHLYATPGQAQAAAALYLSSWMKRRADALCTSQQRDLDEIIEAVEGYHRMLDNRENANAAGQVMIDKIERILGMPWQVGATLTGKEGA